jgi:tetratricopeptide (TPR) repeat protein
MGKHDWYRNTIWNAGIEKDFFAKLARARDKTQYLCIQAGCLTATHPAVALQLVEQYFALVVDQFHDATALIVRADAHKILGNFDAARESYEAALAREAAFPNNGVAAYLYLPSLIALQKMTTHYERGLGVLALHKNRPVWPAEKFYWHGALAMILREKGYTEQAIIEAKQALDASSVSHSGVTGKSSFGTVGTAAPKAFSARLQSIANTLH